MNKLLQNLSESFGTIHRKGFAARKLTAFAFMLLTTYLHYKYVDKTNVIEALMIDCSMILLLLGLVTFEQIIALKNGKESPTNEA